MAMSVPEPVLTAAAMRAAEASSGVSVYELMDRAGRGCAEWIWRVAAGRAVTVLCGPGNNGGDGYVIAEVLHARGLDVVVVAPREPGTDAARRARSTYAGQVSKTFGNRQSGVLVDAFFGTGLSRELEGEFAALLDDAAHRAGYKIAIDLPSGVNSDTGAWLGYPVDYDLTLALGAWKRAHWLMPASEQMGDRRLIDIGLKFLDWEGNDEAEPERLADLPRLHEPIAQSHKYTRGLVAIVAGAMPGAAMLSAQAAMGAGAGYVKLFSSHPHFDAPPDLVIERKSLDTARLSALLIGPGLGRSDRARDLLAWVLELRKPTVIDADALHLLDWDSLEGQSASRLILTPHEGELAQLCRAFDVAGDDKVARAVGLRDATGVNVLAKGPDTVLASANRGLTFFRPGSSWLSVAGSGDVLAGIVASRLAIYGREERAVSEAVWIHSEAARIAGPAFTASALARAVPAALASFL